MTQTGKGGRPQVGPQVSFSIPQWADDRAKQIAETAGQTKAAVLRESIVLGLGQLGDSGEHDQTAELVAPAAAIIARWIGQPHEVEARRARFKEWHRVAGHPYKGIQMLTRAVGELVVGGERIPDLPQPLMARLSAGEGWWVRFALHQATIQDLLARGITVHIENADDDLPEQEEEAEDYA